MKRKLNEIHISKLEKLARRLLTSKSRTPASIWKFQVDLIHYQLDIRRAITKQKSRKDKIKARVANAVNAKRGDWKQRLRLLQHQIKDADRTIQILRSVLKHARQIGDALAYLFFAGDEKKLAPLSQNSSNELPEDEISLKGMLGVAESYFRAGAGYPLIHDATNILRVGDITFCDVANPNDDPLTIEVKTKTDRIEGNIAHLNVNVFAAATQQKFVETSQRLTRKSASKTTSRSRKAFQPDDRLQRQVKRMSDVRELQLTEHGKVVGERGEGKVPLMSIRILANRADHHWKELREVLLKAKEKGFAALPVDDAFLYFATYTEKSFGDVFSETKELPFGDQFSEAVKQIPMSSDKEKNAIFFMLSMEHFTRELPARYRPYLWYEIPIDLKMDILWGRLFSGVVVNLGKIVEGLEAVGLNVEMLEEDPSQVPFLRVRRQFEYDGDLYEVGGPVPPELIGRIGFEYLSLPAFVDHVKQIIDNSAEIITAQKEFQSKRPKRISPRPTG